MNRVCSIAWPPFKMAVIQLHPEHGGDPIDVPNDKITIGRGAFMKVTDKRVSRNHATLEINSNRELIITPIHTNPCFMKVKTTGEKLTLAKDKPQILRNGDLLGLLPDSLYFKVVYQGQDNGEVETSDTETESCLQNDEKNNDRTAINDNKPTLSNNTGIDDTEHAADEHAQTVKCGHHEVALPLKKTRVLPKWMIGAAKRISLNSQQELAANSSTTKRRIATNAQASGTKRILESCDEEASYRPATNKRRRSAPRKRAVQESDEDDWAGEEPPRSRRTKTRRRQDSESDDDAKRNRRRRRRRFEDNSEDSEVEEIQIKKREPRMSAQKLLTYKDEFDLGEVGLSSSESEVGGQFGSWKKDDDSDFVVDELESGSDWEISHSQGSRRGKRKGRTRSVTQTRGRRKSTRRGRRQNYNDSDFDEDDDDVYVPRPSKRRASNSKRQRAAIDEDDSDERRPRKGRAKRKLDDGDDVDDDEEGEEEEEEKKEPKKKKHVIEDDSTNDGEVEDTKEDVKEQTTNDESNRINKNTKADEAESEEEEEGQRHKSRRPCMYGKKCYRKNPLHFKEFCHPGDSSYDEVDSDDDKKKDKPKRGLREKDKKSVLRGTNDDDGEPNTYDYEDSFLTKDGGSGVESSTSSDNPTDEDSEWSPEEENVRSLIKEAKGFIRNRKMQRPARNK
ncbi:hypothetical protein LSH36_427g08042 [Paralvinella palmiformis]|uniref:Aprataxin and PNK-like factor n=1 Tax=Paralvinella palmiformis TaxID=53620 RepID=A0AAD9JC06_9ANNE|nr:hypothetical protein LSH36_427g08042 [Paralvinella palmiformis]